MDAKKITVPRYKTVRVDARKYEDRDDCLTAAAADYAAAHDVAGWDLEPRWDGEERTAILLSVPRWVSGGRS